MRSYSKTIANAVISVFEENGYSYNFNKEDGILTCRWHLDSKLGAGNARFMFRDSDYLATASIDINADEECRNAVIEFLTRMNYQGSFWVLPNGSL